MPTKTNQKNSYFKLRKPLCGAEAERATMRYFAQKGIQPTLAEFREVKACMLNGSNPEGIH